MNVISRGKLRDFYEASPQRHRHAPAFENWFRIARRARAGTALPTPAPTFGQTDTAKGAHGTTATIFDIGGNKYLIVASVDYLRQTVLIRAVMEHDDYDKGLWKRLF